MSKDISKTSSPVDPDNMIYQKLPDSEKVTQVYPEEKQVPLEGLYLGQRLAAHSGKIGRSLVITDFLTDRNGVIAKTDEHHHLQVPVELKNASDWRLSQELMAQADIIISGGSYFKRVSVPGNHAEDILYQFEPGGEFEKLGKWRLEAGYKKRSPDLAIVTRSLDFKIPEEVLRMDRRIVIFTIYGIANSANARALTSSGVVVIGAGDEGIDGNRLIDTLGNEMGYRVIMMSTGPSVLEILLEAKRLDLFYVTEAQREISFDDPSTVKTILPNGEKVSELKEFLITHRYVQENVITEDGSRVSQFFIRYDRKDMNE
jgi:riboflavin biosynthesis pyrimidine reductase